MATLIITIAIVVPTLLAVWFLFTAKSVRLTFDPEVESVSVSGGPSLTLGGIYLLRKGDYQVEASSPGYYDLDALLRVGDGRNQLHHFQLSKLPGLVRFETNPAGADLAIDGIISALYEAISFEAGQEPDWERLRELFFPSGTLIPPRILPRV